jgi:autotransporter-associated beta strand protein
MKPHRHTFRPTSGPSFKAALILAGSIAALLAVPSSPAANTVNNYTGSTTGNFLTPGNWSLSAVPLVTNDAVFPLGAATGIRTLSSGTITVGSLNVLATSGTFSLRNEATDATNSTLTLGGVGNLGNSVSGNSTDLLYVNTGSTLNLVGVNGGGGTGVLGINLGQTGSFNIVGTSEISAVISGATFGFTKTGVGTLTLKPTSVNTYTGPTSVTGGTLTLDNTTITAANPTNLINSGSALSLGGGGALSILGKATGTTSQTVAGATFNAGANVITISRNTTGTSATLALAALTRNTGGVINFRPATAWTTTASTIEIVTTSGINGGALPVSTSFIGAWATWGTGTSTRYAQLNPSGQFLAAPASTTLTATTAANMASPTTSYIWSTGSFTLGGNLTGYALLANNGAASTFTIGANTLTTNGVLAIAAGGTTFSDATGAGGIVVGVENELVLNAAAGGITIGVPIANKAGSNSSVTTTGNTTAASVTLSAQNTYTGGTTITGANTTTVAMVSSVGPAGNPTTGPFGAGTAPLNLAGGQIRATTGGAITIANVVTISADTTFPTLASEKSLIFSGPATLTGGNRILTGNLGATVNTEATIFSGAIGDGGNALGITKAGTGVIRLSGANTYTGPTVVNAGTLQIGDGGGTGSLSTSSALTTNATLAFNRTDTLTQGVHFASVIAGTGAVRQLGSGTTVLNGTNTFTGNVTIGAGVLQITNSSALGTGTKTVTINAGNNKFLDLDGSGGDITLASGISFQTSGIIGVVRNIAGNNTINGGFTMTNGNGNTKIISNGGTLTLAGNITANTTGRVLDFGGTSTGANTFSGSLDNVNTPALAKTDAGTWILSGASTYAGSTTITDGTLKAGSLTGFSATSAFTTANAATAILDLNGFNSSVGSLAGGGLTGGNVALGSATLTAGGDNTSTIYDGSLGGSGGGLTKVGAGTMTLSNPNSYTGTTTVTTGGLIVNSTLNSATVNVGAAGTLGGIGTLSGTVNATGALSPATATTAGTLTIGTLTLNAGSSLTYEFGGTSDLISVTAASGLTINGAALSLFAAGGVTPLTADGTYTLFNYDTSIGGSTANLSVANPQLNKFYQVNDNFVGPAGTITITLTTTTTSEWNGGALDGRWTTPGNWTAGTPNSPGSVATLGTIPVISTSIAVDGAKAIGTLIFDSANAYTVTGGVADTITFTNGIAAGIINITNGSHIISAPVVLSSNLSVTPATGTALTISGLISGSKGITKNGAGTLTLSGSNTFTGPVQISDGTLAVGSVADGSSPSNLGQSTSAAANLVLDGGTLQYTGASGSTNRDFTITSGKTGTIEVATASTDLTLSGAAAASAGALTKTGPGRLILSGANGYTGLTTVNTGVLNIRNATALGTVGSGTSVTSGAALEIQGGITVGAEALTLNGDGIASAGALRSISGVNIYGGLLTLGSAARINTDADSLTLSNTGTITGASFGLTVGGAGNTTINGIIGTTTGTLTKNGGGILTLTGNSTFTGGVTLNTGIIRATTSAGALGADALALAGGELQLANDTGLNFARSTTVSANAQITSDTLTAVAGVTQTLGTLSIGTNTLTIAKGANAAGTTARVTFGATTLTGTPTFSIGTGATLALGAVSNGANTATFTGAGSFVQSGVWGSGAGGLTFDGSFTGSATLSQANTFTGPTLISAGTLQIGNAGTTGSLSPSSTITNNGTLAFSRTDTVTQGTNFANNILGSGALTQTGTATGVLILNVANSYAGLTTVNSGTLAISHANALGTTAAGTTVVSGAGLQLTGGVITNSGEAVSIAGSGVAFFGALQAGTGGGTWAGQVTLDAAGTRVGAVTAETLTVTGSIVGGLAQDLNISGQVGTGIVVLNPATSNTYSGPTNVLRGILRLGKNDALPTGTILDVDFVSGVVDAATFDLASFNQTVAGLQDTATTSVTGKITNSVAATTGTLTINNSADFTYGTSIIENGAGTVAIMKSGAGIQTFTGANTYSGTTTVNAGTLKAGIASVANVSGAFGNNTAIVMADVTGAILDITGFDTQIGSLTGGGVNGGNITLGAATLSVGGNNTSPAAYGGVISGTGAVTKIGTGTLTLSGLNTYTGKTTIGNGTVSVNTVNGTATADQALGKNAALDLGVAATSSGSLVYTGGADTLAKNINILGNGTDTIQNSGSGLLTLSGVITKNGTTLTLKGGAHGIAIITGGITGASANSDLIIDGGTTTLSVANIYNGRTSIINGATLNANVANALPTSVARTVVSMDQTGSGTSRLALAANQSIKSLTGAASSSVNLNGNTLTIGVASGTTTFAGGIKGAGRLIKDTAGSTQVLSGSNDYTGPTQVTGGTLEISGSITGTSDTGIEIASTGTLLLSGGSERVNNAAAMNLNGGTLRYASTLAGGTVETLGTLTLSSTSSIDFGNTSSGTGYDFAFSGWAAHTPGTGPDLTIANWNGHLYGQGMAGTDDRLIFAGDSTARLSFESQFNQTDISFTGFAPGYASIQFDSTHFEIVAVPEPSSTALIGAAGLLGLVGFRKRRRLFVTKRG